MPWPKVEKAKKLISFVFNTSRTDRAAVTNQSQLMFQAFNKLSPETQEFFAYHVEKDKFMMGRQNQSPKNYTQRLKTLQEICTIDEVPEDPKIGDFSGAIYVHLIQLEGPLKHMQDFADFFLDLPTEDPDFKEQLKKLMKKDAPNPPNP